MKYKMSCLKIFLYLIILTVILLITYVALFRLHWSVRNIENNSVFNLSSDVKTIRQYINVTDSRIKTWRKDAYLCFISILYENDTQLNLKTGTMQVSYCAINKDIIGYPYAKGTFSINVEKKTIFKFITRGGYSLYNEPIDITTWNMDIEDMLAIAKANINFKSLPNSNYKYIIRILNHSWEFGVFDSSDRELKLIKVDPTLKTILYVYDEELN